MTHCNRAAPFIYLLRISSSPVISALRHLSLESRTKKISNAITEICSPLRTRGESSSNQLLASAKRMLEVYSASTMDERRFVLREICDKYGVEHGTLKQAIGAYNKDHSSYHGVNVASRPLYFRLLQAIGNIERGVKSICDIRADVLDLLASSDLSETEVGLMCALEKELRELLTLWFCLSNLQLLRLTWQSPADIVEKVVQSDVVHPIRNLIDIRRRLGPHRRCFLFMHEAMPREPLVIVHVALMNKIASSIQDITEFDRLDGCESNNDTAIYYSISSTQRGLRGIDLGNLLIKRVVSELQHTDSPIKVHCTLSPLPLFRSWLLKNLKDPSASDELFDGRLMKLCVQFNKFGDSITTERIRLFLLDQILTNDFEKYDEIKEIILHLAARYLCEVKQPSSGRAFDRVANFHLRNGAEMYRLNWRGNTSIRGLKSSLGLMVNYRYRLDQVSDNSARYVNTGCFVINDQVQSLLRR